MPHDIPPSLQVGTFFDFFPIPPDSERCTKVVAGPVTFVIEPRQLAENPEYEGAWDPDAGSQGAADPVYFGASLHVYGTDDGLEHLRFDCFMNDDAHYHYIRHADGGNLVCPLDQAAEGDPVEWTLGRLRQRLPEMLECAHAHELASKVRDQRDTVLAGIDDVRLLLGKAQEEARPDRDRPEDRRARA